MTVVSWVVTILGSLGALGGGAAFFYVRPTILKMRAEANKIGTEADVAAAQQDDAHLTNVIKMQTDHLIKPLREQLNEVTARVKVLEDQLEVSERLSRQAIAFIRVLLTWISRHLDEATEPVPAPPPDLAREL